MKKLYVYADFDWLQEPLLVGELSYESLRGNDSYGFKYDKDWLRKYKRLSNQIKNSVFQTLYKSP